MMTAAFAAMTLAMTPGGIADEPRGEPPMTATDASVTGDEEDEDQQQPAHDGDQPADDSGVEGGEDAPMTPNDLHDRPGIERLPGLQVTINELMGAVPRPQAFARITAIGEDANRVLPPTAMTPLTQWHETRMTPADNEMVIELCYYATGGYLNTQLRVVITESDCRLFNDVPWLIRAARPDDEDVGSLTIGLRHRSGLS